MTVANSLSAVMTATLPLFVLAFALVSWSLYRGWLTGATIKDLRISMKALGKAQKNTQNRQQVDLAILKWLRFGGGFYGLVALYTWLLIEWDDVGNFLKGVGSLILDPEVGALISLLLTFFIESVMNFVAAIGWPAYWLGQSREAWLLLFLAYGGYWLGIRLALQAWHRGWLGTAIDRALALLRREKV